MTARSGARTGSFDPTEWAARRKSAVEKAARLREERKRGHLDATYTFAPQTNSDSGSNPSSRSQSRQDENDDNDTSSSYHGDSRASNARMRHSGREPEDSPDMEMGRRGSLQRELQDGYAVAPQDDDGPALREITYRQPAPRRPYAEAQQKQPHTDARQPGGGLKAARGVSRPAAEPEQHLNSSSHREPRDLQAGYRDKSCGQPQGIKFQGRHEQQQQQLAAAADGDGVGLSDPGEREAHDTFTSMLRGGEGGATPPLPRGGRRASLGKEGRKPGWNNDTYVPTPLEEQTPAPLPGRPRRLSRGTAGAQQQSPPQQQQQQQEEEDGPVGRGAGTAWTGNPSGWRHKHTRPDWIDSWESQAAAREAEADGSGGRRGGGGLGRKSSSMSDRDDGDDALDHSEQQPQQTLEALPASAKPNLSLLKAKLRSNKTGRRSQSAPHATEDNSGDSGGRALDGVSGGGHLRADDHRLPPASQRLRRGPDSGTRAQTTPMLPSKAGRGGGGGGGYHEEEEDDDDEMEDRRRREVPVRAPAKAMARPQVSPRTTRIGRATATWRGGMGEEDEEEDDERRVERPRGGKAPPARKSGLASTYEARDDDDESRGQRQDTGMSRYGAGNEGPGEEGDEEAGTLTPCPSCGRSFVERALRVHQKVCQKVFQQKRKAFDSRKHRVEGTEQAKFVKNLKQPQPAKPGAAAKASMMPAKQATALRHSDSAASDDSSGMWGGKRGPSAAPPAARARRASPASAHDETPIRTAVSSKPKWKQQSEAFRAMIKQNRLIKEAEDAGKPIPTFKSVPSEPDPSFVQCPHCSRRFNEQAAERHIPKCKSIIAKPKALSKGGGIALGAAARSMGARNASSSSLGSFGGGSRRASGGGRR